MPKVIKGRVVTSGKNVQGEAFLSKELLNGWNGMDPVTGTIIQKNHANSGKSIAGKVFILAGSRGSTGFSAQFHAAKMYGTGPIAMVIGKLDARSASAAIVSDIPVITDLEEDIFRFIQDGDEVRVDCINGEVTIY